MFNTSDCFYLGFIVKIHGKQGEVIAKLDVDNPENYYKTESVFVRLNQSEEQLIPFFIIDNLPMHKKQVRWRFEGVNTVESAKTLVSKELYLPLNKLPKLSGKKFYHHEIIGFAVVDSKHGHLGQISKIFNYPAQSVIEISQHGAVILVPITDEIIEKVKRKEKELHINTPEGLVEMYRNA
ncbi:MAG: 16S rRNA processing protein RimM [Flavobacteriales bacterium]|nr:16S rRNA processing protein RimM [Flavobacteriales bacterium]